MGTSLKRSKPQNSGETYHPRRIEITLAGKWYIALTLGLGIVGITSGNNIIYVIESLLLAGLILSGVLSEQTVSQIDIRLQTRNSAAKQTTADTYVLTNTGSRTLFCVEVGRWEKKKFISEGFISRIGPRASIRVHSDRTYPKRGQYRWDGIAIATGFPFGFAKKIRIIPSHQSSNRIIWPEVLSDQALRKLAASAKPKSHVGEEFAEGEVRPYQWEDDSRNILWAKSLPPHVILMRPRRSDTKSAQIILDLRKISDPEILETEIKIAAQPFHKGDGSLTLLSQKGREILGNRVAALNRLSLVTLSENA